MVRSGRGLVGSTPMDLDSAPVRELDRAEIPACVALAADRGWSPEERKWGLLFDIGTGYGVDDPDGGLAGMVTLAPYGGSLAAVGMMVVAARHGGRGLGRRLMEHVIAAAGDTLVTLYATEHGRPLYEKVGLAEVEVSYRYVGAWQGEPGDHGTRRVAEGDWPDLVDLDREVFGADRSRALGRLPTFADEVRVVESGGVLTGYAARWQNGATAMIGPVVAPDAEHAARLVSALAVGAEGPVRADVESRHRELRAHLVERGMAEQPPTVVMTAGGVPLPGDPARRFAPITVATG